MLNFDQNHMIQEALLLHQNGQLDLAEVQYKKLLEDFPQNTLILTNLGTIKLQKNNLEDGIHLIEKSLLINPRQPNALNNLGVFLQKHNRSQEALDRYNSAIAIESNYPEAYSNKGNALMDLNRFDEALDSYNHAIRIKSDYAQAFSNRGNALKELNRLNDSLESYNQAIELNPNYANAFANRAEVLKKIGNKEKSIVDYQRAIELNPEIEYINGELLNAKMNLCIWNNYTSQVSELIHQIKKDKKVSSPFSLLSLLDEPLILKKASEIYVNDKYASIKNQKLEFSKQRKSKVKVGYFSPDFRKHPIATLTSEIYELHDKDNFEIHAFYFGPDTNDEMNFRIREGVDYFHEISLLSNDDVVSFARGLEIDIAVDLTGFTELHRTAIFAMRVAPIQVSYIGFLGTMGSNFHDYILADLTIIPKNNRKYYSEKVAYLSNYQANDSKRIYPEIDIKRKDIGLPESGFVFCCFNNTYKITPEIFDSWARILNAVKGSVMLIYVDNEAAKNNLKREILSRRVDSSRLFFEGRLPFSEYLARYRLVDLFLDTYPYNAGTTASDALWMGLPVLTLSGNSFSSRMAASLLNAVNIPELITNSQSKYEAKAIELATNSKKINSIKENLANKIDSTPLFDSVKFTKNLESLYFKMFERHSNRLEPDDIYSQN